MQIIELLTPHYEAAWLPWAVQYFFLIGISTAAFFLSLPGLVWRLPAWQGIGRRALLAALVCGLTAPAELFSTVFIAQCKNRLPKSTLLSLDKTMTVPSPMKVFIMYLIKRIFILLHSICQMPMLMILQN